MSRFPLRSASLAALAVLAAAAMAGCHGCGPALPRLDGGDEDAQVAEPVKDAGLEPAVDAGVPPPADGGTGTALPPYLAGEACPEGSFGIDEDAGVLDGDVRFGLCVALRTLSGRATHNGAPVTAPIALRWVGSSGHSSEYGAAADGEGRYDVRVLKGRYEQLLYQPAELFPTHQGMADLGVVDLNQDRSRELGVKSWRISGTAHFGGVPWKSLALPLDTTIVAGGNPSQQAAVQSQAGSYAVRLMEGTFLLGISVPREALGDTALSSYPVDALSVFSADRVLDVDLPLVQLTGTLTVDGQPFPDRVSGAYDYSFGYSVPGVATPAVETFHEGGVPQLKATLPRNTYDVSLALVDRADPVYPSSVYNLKVAAGLDLAATQRLDVALTTFKLEGVVGIDGRPVQAAPNSKLWFYAYAYANAGLSDWFLSYYSVPTAQSTFSIRAFPATYYLALYLDSSVQSELAEGWYLVSRRLAVDKDLSVPVDITTSLVEGTLAVDGVPASTPQYAGTLTFIPTASSPQQGTYRYRVRSADGGFRVRLPRARYEVYFEVNPQAYPEYAAGRQRVRVELDATGESAQLDVSYVTRRVVGPWRVGGEVVPDSRGVLPEAVVVLDRAVDHVVFRKALEGGRDWYSVRVPVGEYTVSFGLEREALPRTAWGDAPLGGPRLVVR